ncbi:MAG: cold-shock protein [Chloroflexota bacterium]
MQSGSIVRLVPQRGFGFIRTADGQEVFFHATGVVGNTPFDYLQEGQAVTFDVEQDTRGRGERAVNVRPAD